MCKAVSSTTNHSPPRLGFFSSCSSHWKEVAALVLTAALGVMGVIGVCKIGLFAHLSCSQSMGYGLMGGAALPIGFLIYKVLQGKTKPSHVDVDQQLLIDQIRDHTEDRTIIVESKMGPVKIWRDALNDLPRLGTLRINAKTIYKNNGFPEDYNDQQSQVFVFNNLAEQLGTEAAIGISHLMNQYSFQRGVITPLETLWGITSDENRTHVVTAHKDVENKTSVITTTATSFTLAQEMVLTKNRFDDVDQMTFYKAKLTITGSLEALATRDGTKMQASFVCTEEFKDLPSCLESSI